MSRYFLKKNPKKNSWDAIYDEELLIRCISYSWTRTNNDKIISFTLYHFSYVNLIIHYHQNLFINIFFK